MTNEDLRQDPMECACSTWPRDFRSNGHHVECPMRPEALIRDAAKAMRAWGADGDGVPDEHWSLFQRLTLASTGEMPHACDECGATLQVGPGRCPRCAAAAIDRETSMERRLRERGL